MIRNLAVWVFDLIAYKWGDGIDLAWMDDEEGDD